MTSCQVRQIRVPLLHIMPGLNYNSYKKCQFVCGKRNLMEGSFYQGQIQILVLEMYQNNNSALNIYLNQIDPQTSHKNTILFNARQPKLPLDPTDYQSRLMHHT